MDLTVYSNRNATPGNTSGRYLHTDTAETFYVQLLSACKTSTDTAQKYDYLRSVFSRVVEQSVRDCQIAFVGLFAKVDYCIRENGIPFTIANLIHQSRKQMFPEMNRSQDASDSNLDADFPHNLKATALLVHYLCNKAPIPENLRNNFPKADRKQTWGRYEHNMLRVVAERWDDNYIWATEEMNGQTLQICYGKDNKILTRDGKGDWSYLKQILWQGAQLNLVRVRMEHQTDICMPELIILEPDYLINVTTIAGCFETYAESPFVNLISKIKPQPNSKAIHLGNLAGKLLDDTVHGKNIPLEENITEFIKRNAISIISCPELSSEDAINEFKKDAAIQKENIDRLIGKELGKSIEGYNNKGVALEPSFFSEVLGIQGRFDFLYEHDEDIYIIEQKSGKGEFVHPRSAGYNPNVPLAKLQHMVQAIIYRALYQYEFERYAKDISMMLLYSKYTSGLIAIPPMPDLFLRAIRMRNLLAWSEVYYAKEGLGMLTTLTPEKLNQKHATGTLWEKYTKPQLTTLLAPISKASDLERLYYLRFLRFLHNEQLLSKMGNKQKENSGFAAIWHDTLDQKKSAGNIYDKLTISGYGYDNGSVTEITLSFNEQMSTDSSNFRPGDIVIFYPYSADNVPNACAQMVNRASIININASSVSLRLRNGQTDKNIFACQKDTFWAIEHDLFESSTSSLYSAMHSFLSATARRKSLLLCQRQPETDSSLRLKGSYGEFNSLVERQKQSRELFIVIGPPGTGKTSHGLVNILNEELLEEGTNVLLLSFTNRAVDEICSKLIAIEKECPGFDFLRIGSDLSCAPEYRSHLLSNRCETLADLSAVREQINKVRVFCGTTSALNANVSLLQIKHFSLAIIDESSQILEPHLIGLLSAHNGNREAIGRIVLIGDHKQLPAVVQQPIEESMVTEPELNAINLTDCRLSLFERLLSQFNTTDGYDPRYVFMLTKQGRMHEEIANFPNHWFYEGKLDIVPLPHQQQACMPSNCRNGITRMLTSNRVSFVASRLPDHALLTSKTNITEAEMIAATVLNIYHINADRFDTDQTVGIIVPYRNQISTVRSEIDKYGIECLHGITIDTVERYQGSQRDYIIYGFTIHEPYQLNFLTNNVFEENGALIDRKLNVAMTRARLHLVIIGNPALLRLNPTFSNLIDYTVENNCYYDVPTIEYCCGAF